MFTSQQPQRQGKCFGVLPRWSVLGGETRGFNLLLVTVLDSSIYEYTAVDWLHVWQKTSCGHYCLYLLILCS